MGYKLAGFDYLGGVELDPKIAEIYKENLQPKYLFVDDIRDFNKREELPKELYNLDILDGSPPCSTFSMAGQREKAWGKEKQFAEGQKMQRLDDLVFVYCDTIAKLKPKVCLLENVAGLCKGNGKTYAKAIVERLKKAGYNVQLFLLNSATMGVPQTRERCFFIGLRDDYKLPKLKLDFNEKTIYFSEIADFKGRQLTQPDALRLWEKRIKKDKCLGDVKKRLGERVGRFNWRLIKTNEVCPTIITTTMEQYILYDKPITISATEAMKIATFPEDYKAQENKVSFLTGMCVPPVMTAQIALQIYEQWLSKIKEEG